MQACLGIGCGRYEFFCFIGKITPLDYQHIRSLGFGAQALFDDPYPTLASVAKFPALEKFTLFYSNADERAHMIGINAHRLEMYEKVISGFSFIESITPDWKWPE
jgi:hypothetical protein